MTLHDIVKKYGEGKGEQTMWKAVHALSKYLEERKEVLEDYDDILRCVYSIMCGDHYDEELAEEQIEQMYYVGTDGQMHSAPYWTDDEMHQCYEAVRRMVPSEYNEWDFRVALNMMLSDYHNLLESWFGGNAKEKALEMTITYLNDPDAPDGNCKVWRYFNR